MQFEVFLILRRTLNMGRYDIAISLSQRGWIVLRCKCGTLQVVLQTINDESLALGRTLNYQLDLDACIVVPRRAVLAYPPDRIYENCIMTRLSERQKKI